MKRNETNFNMKIENLKVENTRLILEGQVAKDARIKLEDALREYKSHVKGLTSRLKVVQEKLDNTAQAMGTYNTTLQLKEAKIEMLNSELIAARTKLRNLPQVDHTSQIHGLQDVTTEFEEL
eukprot:TRINITY_DN14591_c0_g1_i1.p1 TRINITY_DN14591_c0_g1~~TRINITY_DN14591_c0_g1_i1.p1  ORF type:complete len:122 (+),score=18.09 TRINITY_DN14591_c0_g1_i1:206-571(+)